MAEVTGLPTARCQMAIEAASGNLDFAFEILTTYKEVAEVHPDPNDLVYQQLFAGVFDQYGDEMMNATPGELQHAIEELKDDQVKIMRAREEENLEIRRQKEERERRKKQEEEEGLVADEKV